MRTQVRVVSQRERHTHKARRNLCSLTRRASERAAKRARAHRANSVNCARLTVCLAVCLFVCCTTNTSTHTQSITNAIPAQRHSFLLEICLAANERVIRVAAHLVSRRRCCCCCCVCLTPAGSWLAAGGR